MDNKIRLRKGTIIRKGNDFFYVQKIFCDTKKVYQETVEVEFGLLPNNKIIAEDVDGKEYRISGILTNELPKDIDKKIDISNTVHVFVGEHATDLIRDKDVLAVSFNNCVKIIEYAEGISIFDGVIGNQDSIVKAIYTSHKRNTILKAQWMSHDFEALSGRKGSK